MQAALEEIKLLKNGSKITTLFVVICFFFLALARFVFRRTFVWLCLDSKLVKKNRKFFVLTSEIDLPTMYVYFN